MVITIDGDARVMTRLDDAIKAVGSPKKALEDVGDVMLKEIRGNFEEEGARLNADKWVPLAESTLKDRRRRGFDPGPILVRTGELRDSFGKGVTETEVRVTSDCGYYGFHQTGGPNLPKRRMLAFSERMKQEILGEFTRFIANALKGANR